MTCKRQFLLHREDTHSYSTLWFHGRIIGENESCFGEIHLSRHCLHLRVAEPSAVGENRQGIALQGN